MPVIDPFDQKPIHDIVDPFEPKPQPQTVMDKLLGRGGPRYQTFPERAVRDVAGVVKNFIDSARGENPPVAGMIGPAVEAATVFSPMGPESRIARSAVKAAKATIPTQEELATAATTKGYQGGVMEVPLKPHVLADIQSNIRETLHDEHFRDYLAPQVFRAIKELEPVEGREPTVADIEGVRQILGRVAPQEKAAAAVARNKINEYLSELSPHDTALGEDVGTILSDIRGNYAALKRSELLSEAAEKGQRAAQSSGMGANLDNALRQQIKRIRNNPKLLRGFSEEEIKEMDKIIKGGKLTNLARIFSRFGPEHPLTGWGMAAIEGLKHLRALPIIQMTGGHLAQKYAESATQRGIQRLDEQVRMRSPLFRQQGKPQKPLSAADRALLSILARVPLAAGPPNDVSAYLNQQGL